jgi:hypothetical protein
MKLNYVLNQGNYSVKGNVGVWFGRDQGFDLPLIPIKGRIDILFLNVWQGRLIQSDANTLQEEMTALGYRSPFPTIDDLL